MTPKNSASGTDTETTSRRLSECTMSRWLLLGGRIAGQREAITAPAQGLDRV
jgi:hypothetical protein